MPVPAPGPVPVPVPVPVGTSRVTPANIMLLLTAGASAALLPCPPTRWDALGTLELAVPRHEFLRTVEAPVDVADERSWLADHSAQLMVELSAYGALHFTGFTLPRSKAGFREFCTALPLTPCADPLASIGVRGLLSAADDVYEAVNAEELSKTFIGLHNDVTYKLAAPYAAFVCFKAAPRGGEFLVADGRAVLADVAPDVLAALRERCLSVRVQTVPAGGLRDLPVPAVVREALCTLMRLVVGTALRLWLPALDLALAWSVDGRTLQILEQPKPPVNRHPADRTPTFFSSLHSQSAHLQAKRARAATVESSDDEATHTFSGVDAFYGDLEPIEPEYLDHLDEVISRHVRRLPMEAGDVVLLDSYQVLHGRDVFEGPREHGVVWLTGSDMYR